MAQENIANPNSQVDILSKLSPEQIGYAYLYEDLFYDLESLNRTLNTMNVSDFGSGFLRYVGNRMQSDTLFIDHLFDVVRASKNEPKFGKTAANAITLLSRANQSFVNLDLSCVNIPNANLQNANLSGANLAHANLRSVNFYGANLKDIYLGEGPRLPDKGPVYLVNHSTDGCLLATASDNKIYLWDLECLKIKHIFEGLKAKLSHIAFSSDNRVLIARGVDKIEIQWAVATGSFMIQYPSDEPTEWVATKPKIIQRWSAKIDNKNINIEELSTKKPKILKGHMSKVLAVQFTSDEKFLISASADNMLKVWQLESGVCIKTFLGHKNDVIKILTPRENLIVSLCEDGVVRLWDLRYFPDAALPAETSTNYIRATRLIVKPDKKHLLLTGDDDYNIKLWNPETASCIKIFAGHSDNIMSLAVSADGNWVISGSENKTVGIWNLEAGFIKFLKGHEGAVYSVLYNDDDGSIISGSYDGTIKIWFNQSEKDCRTLQNENKSPITSIVLASDNRQIIAGSLDGRIRQWDRQTGKQLGEFQAHDKPITGLAIGQSTDGNPMLASGSNDRTVKLWNKDGEFIKTLQGSSANITRIAFFDEQNYLVAGSRDCTVSVWNIATEKRIIIDGSAVFFGVDASANGFLCTGSGEGAVRYWQPVLNFQGEIIDYELKFSSHHAIEPANLKNCCIEKVIGLSRFNQKLFQQKGAIGMPLVSPVNPNEQSNYRATRTQRLQFSQSSVDSNSLETELSIISGPK